MISLIDDALKIVKSNHVLFSGLVAASLVLTGSLPALPFRIAVTLASTTGHTDCAGSVVVGSETLTFTTATRKTTTTVLSALPLISCSGLDCNILVEAINSGGAPIFLETTTDIKIRMKSKMKSIPSPQGGWESIRESYAISWARDAVAVDDIIRYGGEDYIVQDIEKLRGFASSELIRKLMF